MCACFWLGWFRGCGWQFPIHPRISNGGRLACACISVGSEDQQGYDCSLEWGLYTYHELSRLEQAPSPFRRGDQSKSLAQGLEHVYHSREETHSFVTGKETSGLLSVKQLIVQRQDLKKKPSKKYLYSHIKVFLWYALTIQKYLEYYNGPFFSQDFLQHYTRTYDLWILRSQWLK